MSEIIKKVNSTYLGIVFHPELRGKLSQEVRNDIHEMLKTLAYSIVKEASDE